MTDDLKRAYLAASIAGLIVAICAVALGWSASVFPAFAGLLLASTLVIVWQDLATFTIPDGPLVVIAMIGLASRLDVFESLALQACTVGLDVLICGGALWGVREAYFRYRGVDGLGFGDVKLAAVAGVLLGTETFAWALLLASLAALAFSAVATILLKPSIRIERLPFGAFLAPICWGLWAIRSFDVIW